MLTGSMIGLLLRRRQSERPYAGHTVESLRHKMESVATTPETKALAARELEIRAQTGRAG